MATYYVRTDGSDSNAGTGSGTGAAWKTIGKALGSAGIASGDTVWIAPGIYRESVTINMTSATAETFVKGDPSASQFSGVSAGLVVLTSYTTNDNGAPTTFCLNMNGRDYLTIQDICFVGYGNGINDPACIQSLTYTSTNIKWLRCSFEGFHQLWRIRAGAGVPLYWTVDRCLFSGSNYAVDFKGDVHSSDYGLQVKITSCVFLMHNPDFTIGFGREAAGTNGATAEGCAVYNCFINGHRGVIGSFGSNTAYSVQVKNNVFLNYDTFVQAGTSGQVTEDYNRVVNSNRTNVTAGSNTTRGVRGPDLGQNWSQLVKSIIPYYPIDNGPLDGAGTTDSGAAPTIDFYGNSFAGTPSIGAVEVGTISSGGGLLVHPGTNGRING